ncbi:MAG: hypothetical protein AAFY25_09315 [Pseudomonadota bacterium]
MGKKIATCNYCGTRAVLVLDAVRHELTCSACGAPLQDMKFMPQTPVKKQKKTPKLKDPYVAHGAASLGLAGAAAKVLKGQTSRKKKKKKPMFRRVLEDIFDEIEDIFD